MSVHSSAGKQKLLSIASRVSSPMSMTAKQRARTIGRAVFPDPSGLIVVGPIGAEQEVGIGEVWAGDMTLRDLGDDLRVLASGHDRHDQNQALD